MAYKLEALRLFCLAIWKLSTGLRSEIIINHNCNSHSRVMNRPSGCAGCGICAQNGRLQEKYFSIFFRWNDKNDTPIERARRDLLKTVLKVENGGLEGDLCNFLTPKFPDFTKFSTYLAARNSPLRGVPAEWWKFALTTGRPICDVMGENPVLPAGQLEKEKKEKEGGKERRKDEKGREVFFFFKKSFHRRDYYLDISTH